MTAVRRILIADDDAAIRSLLRLTLPREGFDVLEAADGREAIEIAREEQVDLALLDWQMPGPGGAAVIAAIRECDAELPIVVLTGEHDPIYRRQAEELGATAFLTKPFSPLRLLGVVDGLLVGSDAEAPAPRRP